jgi:hypothetical protein
MTADGRARETYGRAQAPVPGQPTRRGRISTESQHETSLTPADEKLAHSTYFVASPLRAFQIDGKDWKRPTAPLGVRRGGRAAFPDPAIPDPRKGLETADPDPTPATRSRPGARRRGEWPEAKSRRRRVERPRERMRAVDPRVPLGASR